MGVETNPAAVDDLNAAWPTNDEDVGEGDDHLRNIKAALQGTVGGDDTAVSLKLAGGQVVLDADADGIESKASGATRHLLKLLNSAAGIAVATRSDGTLEFYATDDAGVLGDEFGRAAPGGGWALRFNNEDRLTVDATGIAAATAAGVAAQVSLREDGVDRGRMIVDPASSHDVTLAALVAGSGIKLQRNGADTVLLGSGSQTSLYGPGVIEVLRLGASGEGAFLQGLTVQDAPAAPLDVVRKQELDGLDARVAALEARWSGNTLTADEVLVGGDPVVTTSDLATEIAAGIAELATSSEVLAGTDAARVMTPAAFASAVDLTGDGYYVLPGLAMLSFGKMDNGLAGNIAVTFPRAYEAGQVPRIVLGQIATSTSGSPGQPVCVIDSSVTNTGFEVYVPGDLNNAFRGFWWAAIGKD